MNYKRSLQFGIPIVILLVGGAFYMSRRAAHSRYERLTEQGVIAQRDDSGEITQINLWPDELPKTEFELLARMPRLKMLNLHGSGFTDAELQYIEEAHSLEELIINQTQVTDAGLMRLVSLEKLRSVTVDRPMTSVGLFNFSQARPDVKIILRPLLFHGLKHLRDLAGHGELDEKFELVALDLHENEVEDADLEPVAECGQLRIVNLSGTQISDVGLDHLRHLENLRELWLTGTNITDKGLETIAGMKQLQSISLARTKVTDAGMANLESLSSLEVLHIGETAISDAGLSHLKGLRKLKDVYVTQSRVTKRGAAELSEAIPSVRVHGGSESESEKPVEEIESRVLG